MASEREPSKKVVVFDGDGNVLMGMGTLATVGALKPKNFVHVVLDNEVYGSTGNQPTISNVVRLEQLLPKFAALPPWLATSVTSMPEGERRRRRRSPAA